MKEAARGILNTTPDFPDCQTSHEKTFGMVKCLGGRKETLQLSWERELNEGGHCKDKLCEERGYWVGYCTLSKLQVSPA